MAVLEVIRQLPPPLETHRGNYKHLRVRFRLILNLNEGRYNMFCALLTSNENLLIVYETEFLKFVLIIEFAAA